MKYFSVLGVETVFFSHKEEVFFMRKNEESFYYM